MTPEEYLDAVVRPNVAEMQERYGELRSAYNAVMSVDSLAAHLYVWLTIHAPDQAPEKDDSEFRQTLATRNPEFRLVRDMAKALKHVELRKNSPQISKAMQISVRSLGWGQGAWGEARWGGPLQVAATLDDSTIRVVEVVVARSLHFLETELRQHEIIADWYEEWRARTGWPAILPLGPEVEAALNSFVSEEPTRTQIEALSILTRDWLTSHGYLSKPE